MQIHPLLAASQPYASLPVSRLRQPEAGLAAESAAAAASSVAVSISAAARALQSVAAASSATGTLASAPASTPLQTTTQTATQAEFDTSHGRRTLDIEAYFTPPGREGADLGSLPLLLPSRNNVAALSSYVSGRMPEFLAQHGIAYAPASISYDAQGALQLPADYPHADAFRQALAADPVMERALRTTAALSSHLVELEKLIPFQEAYAAANSQAEIEALLARFHYLFAGARHYASIALDFTPAGQLSISHDGKPLAG